MPGSGTAKASAEIAETEDLLRERLATLQPERLNIVDESAKHAGHAGAQGGGKHFRLQIVSPLFLGKSTLQRHRLVNTAVGDLMQGKIHALSIRALTPEEV